MSDKVKQEPPSDFPCTSAYLSSSKDFLHLDQDDIVFLPFRKENAFLSGAFLATSRLGNSANTNPISKRTPFEAPDKDPDKTDNQINDGLLDENKILSLAVALDRFHVKIKSEGFIDSLADIGELIALMKQTPFFEQLDILRNLEEAIMTQDYVAAYALLARLERRSENDFLDALTHIAANS